MSGRHVSAALTALLIGSAVPLVLPAAHASAASCSSYPNWVAGKSYRTGDVVRYTDGRAYMAEHDNPGYDPTISTWYWDPYSCDSGSGNATRPDSWSARPSSTRCSRTGTRSTPTAG